jgi:predicted dehydrogenase
VEEEKGKMSEDRLRVGVLGVGGIGETHFEAIKRVGGVDVVAVARRDEDWVRDYAARHDVPKAYTNWRDLIEDEAVQVVVVCTPNNQHYEHVSYALEKNRYVVVDKPLAIGLDQTGGLLRAAKEKKLGHAITYNHRFLPLIFQMREMIRRGELGRITYIKAHALGDFMLAIGEAAPDHWRMRPETVGLSRTLSTMGGHLLDLLYFITGQRIGEVFADFGYVDPNRKPVAFDGEKIAVGDEGQMEDHVGLLVRLGDGTKGSVVLSEAAPGHKVEVFLEIIGTKQCVSWNIQKINEMWIGRMSEPNGVIYKGFDLLHPEAQAVCAPPAWGQDGFSESFRQLYASIFQSFREKRHLQGVRPDFADFSDGHYMEMMLRAMMRSSRTDAWQTVGFVEP